MTASAVPSAVIGPVPEDWTGALAERVDAALIVDVEGFEGPLDLLLALARTQKVDLARISILALVEQYLTYVERARTMRLELAADYLVMAAWLAYLKSRLLLPEPETDSEEPTASELAERLAFRLRRLEAMREAASRLFARPRQGIDWATRGMPEPVLPGNPAGFSASLYDLLVAYAGQRQKHMATRMTFRRRAVWSLAEARGILERLLGDIGDWVAVEDLLSGYMTTPELAATVRASSFSATLEMVREGKLELQQSAAFSPIYVRGARPQETGK